MSQTQNPNPVVLSELVSKFFNALDSVRIIGETLEELTGVKILENLDLNPDFNLTPSPSPPSDPIFGDNIYSIPDQYGAVRLKPVEEFYLENSQYISPEVLGNFCPRVFFVEDILQKLPLDPYQVAHIQQNVGKARLMNNLLPSQAGFGKQEVYPTWMGEEYVLSFDTHRWEYKGQLKNTLAFVGVLPGKPVPSVEDMAQSYLARLHFWKNLGFPASPGQV
jgi:hypothetical protein